MESIPPFEVERLLDCVDRAVRLARGGALAAGHAELEAGFRRAMRDRSRGSVWAPVLVHRYRVALDSYCERYGVRLS